MKELPILMNGDAVRAILDGRQTQDRRPIKPQPTGWNPTPNTEGAWLFCVAGDMDYSEGPFNSPFGSSGDHLYVRETWAEAFEINKIFYRADVDVDGSVPYEMGGAGGFGGGVGNAKIDKWRPSIHMPKRMSRITLEVERVWVERINEISEADTIAEGCELAEGYEELAMAFFKQPHRQVFIEMWDDIYAAKGFGWNTNCWVWGCEFKVLEGAK